MTAHIHKECIVAAAEDTTRTVQIWTNWRQIWTDWREGWWAECKNPSWKADRRYRVLDPDGTVVAETPAPKPPRVRIPACTLPAPLESLEGHKYVWTVGTYCSDIQQRPIAYCSSRMRWAAREEAQEWLDFLTADREVVDG